MIPKGLPRTAFMVTIWNNDFDARYAAKLWVKWGAECFGKEKRGPWCDFPPTNKSEPLPVAFYPTVILGPPILFLAFGLAGIWIAIGFSGNPRK